MARNIFRTTYPHSRAGTSSSFDYKLFIAVIILSLFGVLMVYNSSVAIALRDFSDPYYYVKEQVRWFVLGIVTLLVFSRIDYHKWYGLALPMLIGAMILLVSVFLPGIGVHAYGASRWINVGFTTLQPAELTKFVMVIYLSAWFSMKEKDRTAAFLILLGIVIGLVILEPDLGTSIIILCIAVLLYFFSGAPVWQFLLLIPLFISGVGALALTSPYRMRRLATFFNPGSDPLGSSYHIRQALIALGSGGVFGVGLGRSRQKFEYLPEANTDSIFAIIGEEMGLIGAICLISFFLFIIWRGFRIAKHAPDRFGMLLSLGVSSWIAIQSILNIAAMVALVPLTGIPLPLVSYGGSSLVVVLAGIGTLLNVSRQGRNL